jgi:uncharacterized membrane protein
MDRGDVAAIDLDLVRDRARRSEFSLLDPNIETDSTLDRFSALERRSRSRSVELLDIFERTHLAPSLVRDCDCHCRIGSRCETGREIRGKAVNLTPIFVFTIEIIATVAGQLLLKHAMEGSNTLGFSNPRVLSLFVGGVLSLTISFFLTIGLLQHFDLSFFYPIQGSTVVIITVAAVFILRERVSLQLFIGALLISVGIAIVSLS